MSLLRLATFGALFINSCLAFTPPRPSRHADTSHLSTRQSNSYIKSATFNQWIDHSNTDLGTFSQFYYYSTQYWGGAGYPVIVYTPGEEPVEGDEWFLTTESTVGVLAKEIQAAMIMLEHRYWGYSSPYEVLNAETLQYLTIENAMSDFTNFAATVVPPFDPQQTSSYTKAPWIFMAGSYPGALAAWTANKQPDVYWAYYSSSAPVQAIENYWQYFTPAENAMPKNCSTDLIKVIDYIDSILINGTDQEQYDLKAQFGLEGVQDNADFALILSNGPQLWLSNQMYQNGGFFGFCDAIENASSGNIPGADGVGLDKALSGYAAWVKEYYPCNSSGCYSTQDASNSQYTNTSVGNSGEFRQWEWLLCNQPLGYWQTGAPAGYDSIVSRLVSAKSWESECPLYFPETDGYSLSTRTVDDSNAYTGGWNIEHPRLLYVNNENDVWREAGVSSDYRPGGRMQSTADHPVIVVPGGYHMSDMISENGVLDDGVQNAISAAVAQMETFVQDFYNQSKK